MARKWLIKRIGMEDLKVSQSVAQGVEAAWKQGTSVITIPGNKSFSASSITAIEETLELDDLTENVLPSGLSNKVEPMVDDEGLIVTNWYKRLVGTHEWEKKYSHLPHYYKLVGTSQDIWVAVRLPEYTGMHSRSSELVQCDAIESRMLNDRQA